MGKRSRQLAPTTPAATAPVTTTPPPVSKQFVSLMLGLGLVVLAFVAYRPCADGEFNWDDDDYPLSPVLSKADGLSRAWAWPPDTPQYYPLVYTSYAVERPLWGNSARGYRETNVLLHGLSAVLLWRILRRLSVPGAIWAAAVFAVHPVMVESVAWITERKNTLSLLLFLAALNTYLRAAGISATASPGASHKKPAMAPEEPLHQSIFYGLSFALFVMALLSKTVTASLPAVVLLLLWWKKEKLAVRDVLATLPFFAVGLIAATGTGYLERESVGASGPQWDFSIAQRILIAGRAVWFYAGKLLFPAGLSFLYPRWQVDPSAWWQWLYPLGLLALIAGTIALRRRIGRGPVAAVLLYCGMLVPALGFVNIFPMRYSFVADHFQYHASTALIAVVVALLTLAAGPRHYLGHMACGVIVCGLLVCTLIRAQVYEKRETVWRDAAEKNPNSWMVWTQVAHHIAHDTPEGMKHLREMREKAVALGPDVYDTHANLARVYLDEERYADAEKSARRAVTIEPRDPDSRISLGLALLGLKQPTRAIEEFKTALARSPNDGRGHEGLAYAHFSLGDYQSASQHFYITWQLKRNVSALEGIRDVLTAMGRKAEAKEMQAKIDQVKAAGK